MIASFEGTIRTGFRRKTYFRASKTGDEDGILLMKIKSKRKTSYGVEVFKKFLIKYLTFVIVNIIITTILGKILNDCFYLILEVIVAGEIFEIKIIKWVVRDCANTLIMQAGYPVRPF